MYQFAKPPTALPLLIVLAFLLTSHSAMANTDCEKQFVDVEKKIESRFQFSHARVSGRSVYFEHLPAKAGKPTLFLLNGMFVPSMDLQGFRDAFERKLSEVKQEFQRASARLQALREVASRKFAALVPSEALL